MRTSAAFASIGLLLVFMVSGLIALTQLWEVTTFPSAIGGLTGPAPLLVSLAGIGVIGGVLIGVFGSRR